VAGGVVQGEGPEFKFQYHKKRKKENLALFFVIQFLKNLGFL
jgi:hypothetical protein